MVKELEQDELNGGVAIFACAPTLRASRPGDASTVMFRIPPPSGPLDSNCAEDSDDVASGVLRSVSGLSHFSADIERSLSRDRMKAPAAG
jgi:hypothetical protein